MSDLRDRLERLSDRARVAPDAFERFERNRRHRERNRRITAGTVALLVAIAGTVAAFNAFRTNDGGQTIGGGGQYEFFALWPESTLADAKAAQAQIETDPSLSWRLDPMETAQHFINDALGWPESPDELAVWTSTTSSDGTVTADLGTGAYPGGCNEPQCAAREVIVRLRQLVEAGGIWSVVTVESPVFNMPLHPGEDVQLGSDLSIASGWPDGTRVAVGFAGTGSCSAFHEDTVEVAHMAVDATVDRIPDGCTGYAYALTPDTDKGSVELGGIVFPRGGTNVKPSIAYTVTSIAAVPVRFSTAPSTEPLSRLAEFTCDQTGTISPSSLSVQAQTDGVHIAVTNTADEPVSFTVAGHESSVATVGGDGADPGERKETVWELPPGDADVSCKLRSAGGIDTSPIARLRVEDPTGSYVPIAMTCRETTGQVSDYVEGAVGLQGDPVEIARQHLSGLEYDDAVQRAGYPNSEQPTVRIVRDGDVVATALFRDDGTGGWLLDTLNTCSETPIGWSDQVTGVSGPMGSPNPTTAWDQLCSAARAAGPNTDHNGADLHILGRDFEFDTRCLIAPAEEAITIRFGNEDAEVPRNIGIYRLTPYLRECIVTGTAPSGLPGSAGDELFAGDIITGPDEIAYPVGRLEPGEYYFQDDVHPQTNGLLVVE